MIIHNVTQWTPEWLNLRKGIITGTRLKAVASAPSTATYKTLMDELIAEDLAPLPEVFQNDAMIRWTMLEPIAKQKYQEITWEKVDEVWFCIHEKRPYCWLSPDWFIKKEGKYTKALEIKCPGAKNHLKYIQENKIPNDYKWQIVNYFLINEDLEELDFMTFNPDIYIEHLQWHIINVKREDYEEDLKKINEALDKFKDKWESQILELTSKNEKKENPKENSKETKKS